jgi:hypothetical protein
MSPDGATNAGKSGQPDASSISGYRAETIDYIGDLLFELRKLASSAGEPLVTYLIDMACQEAGEVQARNYYSGHVRATGNRATAQCDGR